MPNRFEIQQRMASFPPPHHYVRLQYLKELSDCTGRDTILYAAHLNSDSYMAAVSEPDIQGFMSALNGLKGDRLDLILHSYGGSPYVAAQIGTYLHQKYGHIRAIVPQSAMSAATMLACACDEIVMGKHSAIGAIDPQILMEGVDGGLRRYVAARSIIEEFERARKDITEDSSRAAAWYPVLNHPPGLLTEAQKSIDSAEMQVRNWLTERMFADDKHQAARVAKWLAKQHEMHSQPISNQDAEKNGLKIVSLEKDQKLQEAVLSVLHAASITFDMPENIVKIIENQNGGGFLGPGNTRV